MAILKALPGSAKVNGKPVKGKLIEIKKSVIRIDKFLTKRNEKKIKENEKLRKSLEKDKRSKKEEKLEKPKNEWKKLVPKKIPGLSFFDSIRKFVTTWILGWVAIKLIPLLPKLIPVIVNVGKFVNFIIDIGGKFLSGFVSFIHFGVKAQEATYGFLKRMGGEKFADAFSGFGKALGFLLDAAILIGTMTLFERLQGDDAMMDGFDTRRTRSRRGRLRKPSNNIRPFRRTPTSITGRTLTGGRFGRSPITNLGRKALTQTLGRKGTRQLLKVTKNFISPVVKRIPFIGALTDFALQVFVFKERPGKAAFKAIGAGLGLWLGALIGSLIPVAGTFLGGLGGGMLGDAFGGLIYDMIFGGKKPSNLKEEQAAQRRDQAALTTAVTGTTTAVVGQQLLKNPSTRSAIVSGLSRIPGGKAVVGALTGLLTKAGLIKATGAGGTVAGSAGGTGLLAKGSALLSKGAALGKVFTTAKTVMVGGKAVTAAAATGIVVGALGLATLIGELGAQAQKQSKKMEEWSKKLAQDQEDKGWYDPRRWMSWGLSKFIGLGRRINGFIFGLFDIIGAPFRMLIEAIRWPFMSPEQRDQATLNLEKYDARIREQFRSFTNMFDIFGVISDEEGGFGAMNWNKNKSGVDAMYDKSKFDKDNWKPKGNIFGKYPGYKDDYENPYITGYDKVKEITNKKSDKESEIQSSDSTVTKKEVTGRFDMKTGKAYINDKEVGMDEYMKFHNLSQREKLKQYGIDPSDKSATEVSLSKDSDAGKGDVDIATPPSSDGGLLAKLGKPIPKFDQQLLGVTATYEDALGTEREVIVYAPSNEINMIPGSEQVPVPVTSGRSGSSNDDYESLAKGD